MKISGGDITLLIGIFSFIGGVATLYSGAIKKSYAAERDFNHLKNDYRALVTNVAALSDMLDDRLDRISIAIEKIELRQSIILGNAKSDTQR